jgi:hypothetical protein
MGLTSNNLAFISSGSETRPWKGEGANINHEEPGIEFEDLDGGILK